MKNKIILGCLAAATCEILFDFNLLALCHRLPFYQPLFPIQPTSAKN